MHNKVTATIRIIRVISIAVPINRYALEKAKRLKVGSVKFIQVHDKQLFYGSSGHNKSSTKKVKMFLGTV